MINEQIVSGRLPERVTHRALLFCVALGAPAWITSADAEPTITPFDPPGSSGTYAYTINDGGSIAGYYYDSSNVAHGYVRDADGDFEAPIDPPGSTGTYAYSINKRGSIAGDYTDGNGTYHGFVRQADGKITTFDPSESLGTWANGINESGAIVGSYNMHGHGHSYGYVRDPHGKITTFKKLHNVDPASINAAGWVVGSYVQGREIPPAQCAFERNSHGQIIRLFSCEGGEYATHWFANSINDSGAIAGDANDSCLIEGCSTWGWVMFANGSAISFDLFGSSYTVANSINLANTVTGSYADNNSANGEIHGFVWTLQSPPVSFDPRGSTGTYTASINSSGSIAGSYIDGSGLSHGFVRSP